MSMLSNVGNPQIYEASEQRNHRPPGPFSAGMGNARDVLNSDDRSLENVLTHDEIREERRKLAEKEREALNVVHDPTDAARRHGNKPSRGAEIDKEIQEDDEAYLKQKERS